MPRTQMTLIFDWKAPCVGGLTFKKRGQLGSRCFVLWYLIFCW